MADNTKIGPIFRSANGGLSDDLFTGIRNSFYYSNNIEIREDDKSIYPKQTPRTIKFDLETNTKIIAARYFNGAWYIFASRAVYKLDISNESYTKIADWFTQNIRDAELFAGYVYISTDSHLYRIAQNANNSTWGTSTNFTDISLNSATYHPLYATDILMVVGNGSEVGKVTKEVPDQVQTGIVLQSDYVVKFINELGGFIRVTAEDGYYGAEILLWDKVSDAANEVIPMNGYKFLQSRIYNGYHYLLSDKGLGLINGYQFYILKRIKDLSPNDLRTNGMIVYDDKLYFVKTDGIYIYGAKNKNYNDVLSLWSEHLSDVGSPRAIATDGENIIYTESSKLDDDATTTTKVYLYVPGDENGQTGEFQTMGYFGTSMSEIKQAMYLRVGYHLPTNYGGNIDIYYRTEADEEATDDDGNPIWHRLTQKGGLKEGVDMRSPFATSLKLNCRFQWIQFKFVITQSRTGGNPYVKLYSADLYYNDMLD